MAWSQTAALLEDFVRMGLTTSSAIERAYRKDATLLWRLVACFAKVNQYVRNVRGKLAHIVSWCEHFRPYFKRWRARIFNRPFCIGNV
jgi:hypothetical protein